MGRRMKKSGSGGPLQPIPPTGTPEILDYVALASLQPSTAQAAGTPVMLRPELELRF